MSGGYTIVRRSLSSASSRDSVPHPAQAYKSKPSRWITYICVVVIISMWLFASVFLLNSPDNRKLPNLRPSEPHMDRPPPPPPTVWPERAAEVKNAFRYAYSGYQKYASTYDELLPVTGGKANR
jgi:hypothetical protein